MINTILVRLRVPILHEEYDLVVPLDMQLAVFTDVIAKGLEGLSNGKYTSSGAELLSMQNPDILLNPMMTLRDYSIPDGADMILL